MRPLPAALLLDADSAVGDELRRALRGREVQVDVAHDATEALVCIDKHSYCGLIVDLASGFELLHRLSERRMEIPMVVISRELPDSVREMSVVDSIKLVLAKPIESSLLASTVLGLCGIAT
jgi:ActR/RegA family two-component response regulator